MVTLIAAGLIVVAIRASGNTAFRSGHPSVAGCCLQQQHYAIGWVALHGLLWLALCGWLVTPTPSLPLRILLAFEALWRLALATALDVTHPVQTVPKFNRAGLIPIPCLAAPMVIGWLWVPLACG